MQCVSSRISGQLLAVMVSGVTFLPIACAESREADSGKSPPRSVQPQNVDMTAARVAADYSLVSLSPPAALVDSALEDSSAMSQARESARAQYRRSSRRMRFLRPVAPRKQEMLCQ